MLTIVCVIDKNLLKINLTIFRIITAYTTFRRKQKFKLNTCRQFQENRIQKIVKNYKRAREQNYEILDSGFTVKSDYTRMAGFDQTR